MTAPFNIAVIPGDGIGKEVMPEGLRVLDAAARRFDIPLRYLPIEWASCDYYLKTGQMMPDDWKAQLSSVDAIYFGAVGWPAAVPDHVSLWGSLLKFRREFDQYINLRPARTFAGVSCPLAGRGPGDIDIVIVRENTEGEYSAVGGVMFEGTPREVVTQQAIFTRHGAERVLRFAFELARKRRRKHVTVATKSNGIAISMPWWDARAAEVASRHPDVDLGQATHRHPVRAFRPAAAALRCRRRHEPVRRHSVGPRAGMHRHDRPGAVRQSQSGAHVSHPCSSRCMGPRPISPAGTSPIPSQ